ncbi:hypothetical protein HLB23_38365 [Nocardia uniformis]|uniref:Acyl-protein synthetase LuxE domain-containing protein n=1 Tax=Nocardia uniformis TaxID=53432 RepID=A0A849C9Z5_9NOCA|nr:hypothetical protein [Nocardia uniformis]NNH75653.1 hypothetical protein [Nocardia uniformis]
MTLDMTSGHTVLNAVYPVDRLVFGDAWTTDDPALRIQLIRDSVRHHLDNCALYACYAERLGFSVELVQSQQDLAFVPQLPTTVFKRGTRILSCDPDAIARRCTSSGTQGRLSEVYRDRTTIERLLGSVRRGVELLGDWHEDEVAVLNLGPSRAEAGDLWFAYVMSLIDVPFHTEHAVHSGVFDRESARRALVRLRDQFPTVVVIGPPALVLELAGRLDSRGRGDGGDLLVVTAGGWKRYNGKVLDRSEFTGVVRKAFGLRHDDQVRDAFNQVELNTIVLECAQRRKHLPPWLEVIVRDPRTLKAAPGGAPGLLSYLDPTAVSYPGFILADDYGSVCDEQCPCGVPGRTLEHHRRVERTEEWGCALKMDRDYAGGKR